MSYLETIRQFVVQNFMFGEADRLKDDMSFLKAGIIDSTGILELIMFLEGTFAIKVEDNELIPANLDNLTNVAEFVSRKLNNKTGNT